MDNYTSMAEDEINDIEIEEQEKEDNFNSSSINKMMEQTSSIIKQEINN